ncbi:MAG: polyprenol monophosphomannose synthase [Bacteroidetes bacterium]|nr:polyprenol monophosphomannose synthase [Bacteroidota bacterium]
MNRTLIIIPTYNEADNIALALRRIMGQPSEADVLVVDDGSPDGTAQIVRQTQQDYPGRIELLERSGKLGLGTAYLKGFDYALNRDYQIICNMDADLSHNPDDLPTLINAITHNQCDLAIGSRYIGGVRVVDWPLSRLLLSYSAGCYTRVATRLTVRDVTAGFLAYHRRVLESVDLNAVRSNGYSFLIEMKYRTWKKGFRLLEIPITFTERTEGQSKMSRAIICEAALKVWELRLRSIIGQL